MIKFENTVTPSPEWWQAVMMGARNPLNSWHKSDSAIECTDYDSDNERDVYEYQLGTNDYNLLMKLRNAGTADHRKYMRMLPVIVDITAPLYWWPEFDQYKVGTTTNSCSKMHTIHKKEFTLDDFSFDDFNDEEYGDAVYFPEYYDEKAEEFNDMYCHTHFETMRNDIIMYCEMLRKMYVTTKNQQYWRMLIQLLPEGFNQKRTVILNYEVLANMYKSRKNHKLVEWRELCKWIESLPYSELITGIKDDDN